MTSRLTPEKSALGGTEHTTIEPYLEVLYGCGFWNEQRRKTHGFLLSPDVYRVSKQQQDELTTLGEAIHASMLGLDALFVDTFKKGHHHLRHHSTVMRACRVGIPEYYHDLQQLRDGSIPAICKVDLMETPQGTYRIAEIDGHNKHGMGYSTIGKRLRQVAAPGAAVFPGAAAMLAAEIRDRGVEEAVLLYSQRERFYRPELLVLQDELAQHGITLHVVPEGDRAMLAKATADCRVPMVDLPFLNDDPIMRWLVTKEYRDGNLDFLIPPKPWCGSKAVLALLRNDDHWPELEAMLLDFIPKAALDRVREAIPETYLLRQEATPEPLKGEELPSGYVLKESISSGMKGTIFTDDERFEKAYRGAKKEWGRFILQEEVTNAAPTYRYFTDAGELAEQQWYQRVTVHYVGPAIADLIVTARPDKRVHGAPDCLQLGAVLEA